MNKKQALRIAKQHCREAEANWLGITMRDNVRYSSPDAIARRGMVAGRGLVVAVEKAGSDEEAVAALNGALTYHQISRLAKEQGVAW